MNGCDFRDQKHHNDPRNQFFKASNDEIDPGMDATSDEKHHNDPRNQFLLPQINYTC